MKQLIIVLLFCISVQAQQITFEFEKECGKPGSDSDFAVVLNGKVTKIIDGNTILVNVDGRKRKVDLVAVDTDLNESAAKAFLFGKILNQSVELQIVPNFRTDKSRKKFFYAVVEINGTDMNRYMIENGIARYKAPKPFNLINHKECVYQHIENKAKEAKVGIWAQ